MKYLSGEKSHCNFSFDQCFVGSQKRCSEHEGVRARLHLSSCGYSGLQAPEVVRAPKYVSCSQIYSAARASRALAKDEAPFAAWLCSHGCASQLLPVRGTCLPNAPVYRFAGTTKVIILAFLIHCAVKILQKEGNMQIFNPIFC